MLYVLMYCFALVQYISTYIISKRIIDDEAERSNLEHFG